MGKIIKDMRGSILKICDFMLGHISNATLKNEIAESIVDKMVARYEAKTKASHDIRAGSDLINTLVVEETQSAVEMRMLESKNWTLRHKSHVTQGILNDTERQLLREQLEEDPILGNILLQIREIVSIVIAAL